MPAPAARDAASDGPEHPPGGVLRGDQIGIGEAHSPVIRHAWEAWNAARGKRLFPARLDVSPRALGRAVRNAALVKVIDGGRDFQFRVIGDAIVQAQGASHNGMMISQIDLPGSAQFVQVMAVYREVIRTRAPLAFRGMVIRPTDGRQLFRESLILPLGPLDDEIDHILAVIVYSPLPDAPLH